MASHETSAVSEEYIADQLLRFDPKTGAAIVEDVLLNMSIYVHELTRPTPSEKTKIELATLAKSEADKKQFEKFTDNLRDIIGSAEYRNAVKKFGADLRKSAESAIRADKSPFEDAGYRYSLSQLLTATLENPENQKRILAVNEAAIALEKEKKYPSLSLEIDGMQSITGTKLLPDDFAKLRNLIKQASEVKTVPAPVPIPLPNEVPLSANPTELPKLSSTYKQLPNLPA